MICSHSVLEQVLAEARSAAPRECCGMLLGDRSRILAARPARNRSEHPNRFVVDPQDHIAARREARAREWEVLGFYHSHPHSPPVPSPTDVAELTYDGCLYLIVSLVSEPAARLFRMQADGPRELEMIAEAA